MVLTCDAQQILESLLKKDNLAGRIVEENSADKKKKENFIWAKWRTISQEKVLQKILKTLLAVRSQRHGHIHFRDKEPSIKMTHWHFRYSSPRIHSPVTMTPYEVGKECYSSKKSHCQRQKTQNKTKMILMVEQAFPPLRCSG